MTFKIDWYREMPRTQRLEYPGAFYENEDIQQTNRQINTLAVKYFAIVR